MNRLKIAQYIALGATACTVIGFFLVRMAGAAANIGLTMMVLGMMVGLVSYIFGGLLTAIKMAGGIATWGWIIVPFPYDIATFLISFTFALLAFLFLPIIPVRKAYKESMKN